MATIEKLSLCGLRSFGPYEEDIQHVKFSSPLTLFLGENGCGKTTIIEALKFACSGDVPGGSKGGQGFVNDPKLTNKATTKAQVRLKLSDARKSKYLVIKSVQVVNKGITSSFKRLDTTLKKVNPDGTETSISSRCADIDSDVCDILGVSKAILNNVIFCHQENAAWPLDEPKKLKEKFDEIFGASEYNKCAETIRKIIKEKDTENKILSSRVGMLKQTKEIVDKKRSDLQEKEEKFARHQEEINEKKENRQPITVRLQEISELETNLGQLQDSRTEKETKKAGNVERQNDYLKNIVTEYEGSDEELQNEFATFELNREKFQENLDNAKEKEKSAENEHKKLTNSIDRAQIKLGEVKELKKQYQNTVTERNNVIKATADKFDIHITTEFNSDDDVLTAIKSISKWIENSKTSLKSLRQEYDAEEVRLQKLIDECRGNLSKTEHNIESKNKQIRDIQNKNRGVQSQIQELKYSDQQLDSLKSKINSIDSDLQHLKTSFDVDAVNQSMNKDKQSLHEQEEKMETLERERKTLQQNRVTEAEIENQNHEIVKRESEIHKLKNKHFENFNKIFGNDIPNLGVTKRAVENHKQINTNKINEINKKISKTQKEATTYETEYRFQKKKLQTLEKELKESERQIFELCKGKPFDKECNEAHQTIEKLQKRKGQYSSGKIMYEKFLQDFQSEKPCCPICQTGFMNKQAAVSEILSTIRSKIQGIPQQLLKVEEELKLKQQQHNKLLQLKPVNDKIEELNSSTIPTAKSENDKLETASKKATTELNELTKQLTEPQSILDACNRIIGDAALLDQHHFEIIHSKSKVTELESQLLQVPSNRSLQQTEAEIDNTKMDITTTRRNYETSQRKLQQHQDRCQGLHEQKSKHVEKQLQLEQKMQGKPQLQGQLEELNNAETALLNEIEELQLNLVPLRIELSEAEKAKETIRSSNRKKLNDEQEVLHRNEKILNNINELQKKAENYIARGGDQAFEAVVNEHNKLKETELSLQKTKKEIANSITEISKQLANLEGSRRLLDDNVKLRKLRKDEQKLSEQIADINRQIGNHNYRSVHAEKLRLREEEDKLIRDINQCQGRSEEIQQEINKLKTELNLPDHKQAHTNYKKAFIEYTVAKEGVANLQLYLKALEIAVLTFHKERMNQINKIIRHLWRSIYKGNDCDYVEIKTDETKTSGIRRTYNYKVVQMKSNVEIEMRGRCSAGQKVLACLIIRMALAETFSKNCGILALDEPTTNLDRANINSLSEALARIVNARQAEKNFQLLIITHDEEFLAALSRVDKVSYFWRVSRNDKGNSIIRKESI